MNFDYFRNWCMSKLINIIVVIFFLLFVIFIIFVAGISSKFQSLPTNSRIVTKITKKGIKKETAHTKKLNLNEIMLASASALSNKKIEWGIRRAENHNQPTLGETNKKTIEEFGGIAMGNNQKPYIYLTFDVGYEGGFTNKIIDTLKENEVKATFFITGQFAKTNPELVKRMIDEGHIVGNHTPRYLMSGVVA